MQKNCETVNYSLEINFVYWGEFVLLKRVQENQLRMWKSANSRQQKIELLSKLCGTYKSD